MMNKLALILSLLVTTPTLAADTTSEQARLAGTWTAIEAQRDGAPDNEVLRHQLTFTGSRFSIVAQGKQLYAGHYVLDPDVQPARIDFHHDAGEAKGTVWKGIYQLEGNRLVICDDAFDPTHERPMSFTTSLGSGHVLVAFRR